MAFSVVGRDPWRDHSRVTGALNMPLFKRENILTNAELCFNGCNTRDMLCMEFIFLDTAARNGRTGQVSAYSKRLD